MVSLGARDRGALRLQRACTRPSAWLFVPLAVLVMRLGMGWRIEDVTAVRAQFARLRKERGAPLLVCANHLTMVDSFIIAWALGGVRRYLTDPPALPWNTPERTLFADRWWRRAAVWLAKCVPIERGASREAVGRTLAQVQLLLAEGEVVLIFPEGGRSRGGRVEPERAAYGVGRLVRSLPGCRVLCVYLRGRGQVTRSTRPIRGEHFDVRARVIEPKSDERGVRASLDVSRQIVGQLAELEREVLDGR